MKNYYLAIDLGASGGRHILGSMEGAKLILEEVHRFSHKPELQNGSLIWEIDKIYEEIYMGIEKAGKWLSDAPANKAGKISSIGIDCWGVDYALLDSSGALIPPVYAYRDLRTEPFYETALSKDELYSITGIAFQPFNTIYQILADKAAGRLEKAAYMLQLPEYFSHLLAGIPCKKEFNEYTMASTTGLLDARKKEWSSDLFSALALPAALFKPVKEPPYSIGCLSEELQKRCGFNADVLMIASHDTASAVACVDKTSLYISSGTWSLLGITGEPVLNSAAMEAGYTNEGAHNGSIRFLKNIMGLWVLQSLRRELGDKYSFSELENMAMEEEKNAPPDWNIDLNLPRFFSPSSMITEIKEEYRSRGMKVPEKPEELAYAIYTSLANCYKVAVTDLEKICGRSFPSISIIGGGSKDAYLNSLTARYTGKKVFAGPSEATSTGNILLQMQYNNDPAVKNGFSELVSASFDVREF